MSILADMIAALAPVGIPIETGVFSDVPPDDYIVLTPMADVYVIYADNQPLAEIQEVRLSLFSKGNYIARKNEIARQLLQAGFTITDRRYIGHEDDTGYHHYAIDVSHEYKMEEE